MAVVRHGTQDARGGERRQSGAMNESPPPMATEHPASPERATSVGSNRRHLAIVLGVALVTLGVDVVAAWLSGSLALIADAAHRVTDVIGISIAFGAATIAARPRPTTARSATPAPR